MCATHSATSVPQIVAINQKTHSLSQYLSPQEEEKVEGVWGRLKKEEGAGGTRKGVDARGGVRRGVGGRRVGGRGVGGRVEVEEEEMGEQ